MREIRFRAYIKNLKWIVPVERINFDIDTVEVDLTCGNGDTAEYEFGEIELMQFTGLLDKNGKEIYEGDLAWDSHNEVTRKIIFDEGKFLYESEDLFEACDEIEIIGNVFENPEVLKESSHESL